jgi:hypothetical protein
MASPIGQEARERYEKFVGMRDEIDVGRAQ